jgi:hypothetical protein
LGLDEVNAAVSGLWRDRDARLPESTELGKVAEMATVK